MPKGTLKNLEFQSYLLSINVLLEDIIKTSQSVTAFSSIWAMSGLKEW